MLFRWLHVRIEENVMCAFLQAFIVHLFKYFVITIDCVGLQAHDSTN